MKELTLIVFFSVLSCSIALRNEPCRSGFLDGRRIVKNEWNREFQRDCRDIDYLAGESRRAADRTYRRARTWKEREFNRCAREGVQDMVERYERLCASFHP